jgi:hypothetical protein
MYGARLSVRARVLDVLPKVAVRVAVCVDHAAATVAVNVALVAPAGTVREAGTLTAVSLLESCTTTPPAGAAALSVTVQESDPAPVNDTLLQETALKTAAGLEADDWMLR